MAPSLTLDFVIARSAARRGYALKQRVGRCRPVMDNFARREADRATPCYTRRDGRDHPWGAGVELELA